MRTLHLISFLTIGACLTVTTLSNSSCSNKLYFDTSEVVPAARGYVTMSKDNNHNYNIEVTISNLAEVERLQGGKKTYVVWMTSDGGDPKNLGQITSDTKRYSKKLSASFQSVSATKPTRVFVTAEEDGTVKYPGNFEVLTTRTI
jgi:hypothetical protein